MNMNFLRALPFALCLLADAQDAPPRPAIMQIGELPGEKSPDLLRSRERNPFTRRETKLTEVAEDRASEETQLRALFKAMSITGVIRGGGEVKVLLDNLILEQGRSIPPLLDGQTERLVVGAITDRQVEINFVESDEHAEPRKIFIGIDLHPRVAISRPALPKIPTEEIKATPARSGNSTSTTVQ